MIPIAAAGAVVSLIELALKLGRVGLEGHKLFLAYNEALDIMVKQGRDPTDAELDAIRSKIVARGQRIDSTS